MTITLLCFLCVSAVLASLLPRTIRSSFLVSGAFATGILALTAYITVPVILGDPILQGNGLWYLDPLAATLALLIALLQWSATLSSISYLDAEYREHAVDMQQVRRYFTLLFAFVLSMLFSVISNNLGFMWVALEATTLATTLLVGFYAQRGSLEAAWKYLVLCSTGISLGLIGLLLTYHAADGAALSTLAGLDWTHFVQIAPSLSPHLMQLAFIFILIGYGTKVGLVPMHAWLPDAHSRAPAPISALLSGVLLNAALFSILRYKALVDLSLGNFAWSGQLLLVFGVLSCVVPAGFILVQTDYKRLLAYSSIEHMGITTFLFGLGPVGAFAGVVHLIGHALSKSMLFFGAANIYLAFKSTKFSKVSGVLRTLPYTGALFLAGMFALLAVPPSPLFLSEYLLFSGALLAHPIASALIALALTVIAAGFLRLMMPLLHAEAKAQPPLTVHGEKFGLSHVVIALHLMLIICIGIALWTPGGAMLIAHIASI